MMITRKSLYMAIVVSATTAMPLLAQDLQSGLKDLEAERYPKAEQTFKQLAASPNAENQFYLGYFYLRTGKSDLAKAAFEKGLATDPNNQLNNVGLAAVALAKKDRAAAKAKIDEAVAKTKSKNQEVLFRAGEAYTLFVDPAAGANDPAEAVRLLDMAKKLDKKNQSIDIPMAMGDAYMIKNDGGQAVSRYEDALAMQPNLAEANYKIGRLYLRGKQYKLAQEYFNKAIENDPEFAPTYRALADALANSRAYKGASTNYEKYVQKSGTTDPELLLDVARYYFLAGDYLKATSYLDQLKGKITNPIMDRMYGWAYSALGKNDQAVESLNTFITTAPQKVIYDDYLYLGRAYGQLGTPEADSLSIINLEKAAPQDTVENVYREIAQKYYSTKRWDRAADYYSKAISNDKKPTNSDFLNLGLSNYQAGLQSLRTVTDTTLQKQVRYQYFMKADSAFNRLALNAESLGKPYPVAYYYRGQSNYYAYPRDQSMIKGDAVPYYEKFLELANAETDATAKQQLSKYMITAYKFLASNALTKKDDAKAKEYFAKVLELDPNDVDVKKALEAPAPAAPAPVAKPKAPVKKKA